MSAVLPAPEALVQRPAVPAVLPRGVGLLGCGTVGAAVARRLLAGQPGLLRAIAVRHPEKARDVAWERYGDDPFAVVDDPDVGIVVECIGGVRLARELVLRAIAHGKDVVTANKDLIAREGPWLAAFAARTGSTLRYEAAVGGAIPILRTLEHALAQEDVLEVGGVLNGTTNFILSEMEGGAPYAKALAQAQRLGFAEPDPRHDVEGLDTASKLAILASRAFRRPVAVGDLRPAGITTLTSNDVTRALADGRRLKLVALARRTAAGVEAGVAPVEVPLDHPFARPNGPQNVVRIVGRNCGPLEFFGLGAGGDATASSVIADIGEALARRGERVAPIAPPEEPFSVELLRLPFVVRGVDGTRVTEPLPIDAGRALKAEPGVRSAFPLLDDRRA
jgi:homoserine dehydrogenase